MYSAQVVTPIVDGIVGGSLQYSLHCALFHIQHVGMMEEEDSQLRLQDSRFNRSHSLILTIILCHNELLTHAAYVELIINLLRHRELKGFEI